MSGDYETLETNQPKITYSEEIKIDGEDIQIVVRQVESIHCQVAEYPTSEYLQSRLELVHCELKRLKEKYEDN